MRQKWILPACNRFHGFSQQFYFLQRSCQTAILPLSDSFLFRSSILRNPDNLFKTHSSCIGRMALFYHVRPSPFYLRGFSTKTAVHSLRLLYHIVPAFQVFILSVMGREIIPWNTKRFTTRPCFCIMDDRQTSMFPCSVYPVVGLGNAPAEINRINLEEEYDYF